MRGSELRPALWGAVTILLALVVISCTGSDGEPELNPTGYLSVTDQRVLFIGWDQIEGELSGTIRHTVPSSGPGVGLSSQEAAFTATQDEDLLTFSIQEGQGFPSGMRATLTKEKLTVYVPTAGIVVPIELQPATIDEYRQAVQSMRERLAETPRPVATPTPLTPAP